MFGLLKRKRDARIRNKAYDRMFNEIDYMLATMTVKKATSSDYVKGCAESRHYIKSQIKQICKELKGEESWQK